MSLLFVGYEFEKVDFSDIGDTLGIEVDPEPYFADKGIFAIADSAITTFQGGKTLLTGFRKIYDFEAKLWKPSFSPAGDFAGYSYIYSKCPYLIGFAGNTLVAQHILNSITGHLEHLKISCVERDLPSADEIQYSINLPCEKNILVSPSIPTQWGDDTFMNKDFVDLLTAEYISDAIEHSINHALSSARQHRLDQNEFNQMYTDIFCGVFCPKEHEHQIYIYRMKTKMEDGILIPYTEKKLLNKDSLGVLGMRNEFESEANTLFRQSVEDDQSPSETLEEYMNTCIGQVLDRGSFEINKPIISKKLDTGRIVKKTIK